MSAIIETFVCPDAANYDGQEGRIVYESAPGEITLVTDGNGAGQKPVGIIVKVASTENGADVSVCMDGPCHVKLSSDHTLTKGTQHFGSNNSGYGHQLAAGDWVVGRLRGRVAPAASQLYPCIVKIENAVVA